jgi:hypothetical protein
VVSKVNNAASSRENRADKGRATEAKPNHFTMNAIFLSGEGVGSKCGGHEFGNCGQSKIELFPANEKLDVSKREGRGVRRGSGVLAQPKQVEESSAGHVSNSHAVGGIRECSDGEGMVDYGDGNRFDPMRGWVGTGVAMRA